MKHSIRAKSEGAVFFYDKKADQKDPHKMEIQEKQKTP